MNLKNLSDKALLQETEKLAKQERELLTVILHHLKEIDRRRLFSDLKCASLFEYAVRFLGYSEDQACRRIAAMRLLRELPELESRINSGALNLTHLGMAQNLFRKERKAKVQEFSKMEKLEVLDLLEFKSTREAQKVVLSRGSSPEQLVRDQVRAISQDLIEIKFVAPELLQHKISHVKGLLAHKCPEMNMGELINYLCDMAIQKLDLSMQSRVKLRAP